MGHAEEFVEDVVEAREVGIEPERLQRVKRAIEEDVQKCTCDAAVFVVARRGKVVMHEAVGKCDLEKGRQARLDDVFFIMSLTKQMATTAVLMAIEEGRFRLNTPICEVIPEFEIKGKRRVNVFHVLTHTSGLNTEIPYGLPVDQLTSIEAVTAAMANERLLVLPGTMVSYNPITSMSLLATMVQRTDEKGRPFRQILAEDVFGPLGMLDTTLGLPDRLKERIVPVVVRDKTPGLFEPLLLEAFNYLSTEETELPAGGGVSRAMDVCRFAEMYRRGGELNGARLLAPETVKMALTDHTGDMTNHLWDYMREMYGFPVFPAHLGLTFFLRGEGVVPSPLGLTTSPRTFAGIGAGSALWWVDPERDLTFVFLSAGLIEEGKSYLRLQRLSDLVVASVVD